MGWSPVLEGEKPNTSTVVVVVFEKRGVVLFVDVSVARSWKSCFLSVSNFRCVSTKLLGVYLE